MIPLSEAPGPGKSEIGGRKWLPGAGVWDKAGDGKLLFNEAEFLFGKKERAVDLDGGDGCTFGACI